MPVKLGIPSVIVSPSVTIIILLCTQARILGYPLITHNHPSNLINP